MREETLNKLALSKGVAVADEAALRSESKSGIRPVVVTHEGLQGADHKHMLVHGTRSFAGVAKGAAFYDPVTDEVALVLPRPDGVWVRVGPLELREVLKGGRRSRWNSVLLAAVERAREAPANQIPFVSNWLVRRVAEAADEALQRTSVSGTHDALVRLEPEAIWRALGDSWVAQPWGIPLPPRALGGTA